MEIRAGSLHLTPRPLTGANRAIDHFLFSLAKDHAAGSVGIIRSGEGSDGAEGIKILKEDSGGVTMAQEPSSAASQSMPVNAIQIDHVDHLLSPEAIAHQLAAMSAGAAGRETAPFHVLWMRKRRPKSWASHRTRRCAWPTAPLSLRAAGRDRGVWPAAKRNQSGAADSSDPGIDRFVSGRSDDGLLPKNRPVFNGALLIRFASVRCR